MTPDIYQKSFIILRHLELIDATCFNRKRLYSVFQFLAHASNKDKQVKLMTCWGLVWSAKDEGVVLCHMLKNLMNIMVHHFFFDSYWFKPEFVWVLENLESPGILLWHFPGLESLGKGLLVLESAGNLLNSSKKIWNVWQTARRIKIEILGVKGLMWILESWKFVSEKGYEPWIMNY